MEAILLDAPPSRRIEVDPCIFIDSNHVSDRQIRGSRTRFMMYSKKQPFMKTSVLVQSSLP